MRKSYIFLLIALLIVLLAAGLTLFPQLRNGGEKPSGKALARTPAKAPVPVVTAVATNEPFTETLEALGTAKAKESVMITPTMEERVIGIFFEDGDYVSKGQVLLKLDDSEAQYLLAEAKAALQEQQKQFKRI